MTTKTKYQEKKPDERTRKIIKQELESRITMLEHILWVNGFEVAREKDYLRPLRNRFIS